MMNGHRHVVEALRRRRRCSQSRTDVELEAWLFKWLGADMSTIADWFVEHRLTDGRWNCMWLDIDRSPGEASRRLTFHALRVPHLGGRRSPVPPRGEPRGRAPNVPIDER